MSRFGAYVFVVPLAAGIGYWIATFDPQRFDNQPIDTVSGTSPALRERLERNHASAAYKEYLVRELVVGRMTLADVADEFLRVNAEEPPVLASILRDFPGANDREKSAHNVIAFACSRCLTAAQQEEVMTRLATEFAGLFGHQPADVTT